MPYIRQVSVSQLLLHMRSLGQQKNGGNVINLAVVVRRLWLKLNKKTSSCKYWKVCQSRRNFYWKIKAFCHNCISEDKTYQRFMSILWFCMGRLFHSIKPEVFFDALCPSPNVVQLNFYFFSSHHHPAPNLEMMHIYCFCGST